MSTPRYQAESRNGHPADSRTGYPADSRTAHTQRHRQFGTRLMPIMEHIGSENDYPIAQSVHGYNQASFHPHLESTTPISGNLHHNINSNPANSNPNIHSDYGNGCYGNRHNVMQPQCEAPSYRGLQRRMSYQEVQSLFSSYCGEPRTIEASRTIGEGRTIGDRRTIAETRSDPGKENIVYSNHMAMMNPGYQVDCYDARYLAPDQQYYSTVSRQRQAGKRVTFKVCRLIVYKRSIAIDLLVIPLMPKNQTPLTRFPQ